MSVIYKISFKNSNRFYIGSSLNFAKRKSQHLNRLRKNKHINPQLQKAFNKYGESQITFEILEFIENVDLLLEAEQRWINKYKFYVLYNICKIAGNTYGRLHSRESRRKISLNHHKVSGKDNPMYGKKGNNNPNYGKQRSLETKTKISNSLKGRRPWNKGLKLQEHSDRMKGENNPFYGKRHTDENKAKISEQIKKTLLTKGGKKLNIHIVREIRNRYNTEEITITKLAKEYNISRNTCSDILKGVAWNE